jgi:hypothetical protein
VWHLCALAIALLGLCGSASAQPPAPDLTGTWTGSVKLTNEWSGASCAYAGEADPPAIALTLRKAGGRVKGSLALDVNPAPGTTCPPLRKRWRLAEVVVSGGAVSFTDTLGHEWRLGVRDDVLVGLVAWKVGGQDEPLAEGFRLASGDVPLTRLTGEVSLKRSAAEAPEPEPVAAAAGPDAAGPDAAAPAAAVPAGSAPAKPAGASWVGNLLGFAGANVVGVGAILLTNKLLQESVTAGGAQSCSPRRCTVGLPGQGCDCPNGDLVTGASCGTTASGVAYGGSCALPGRPCAVALSCNSGRCEDISGQCPF